MGTIINSGSSFNPSTSTSTYYGTCSTAAATQAKVATITDSGSSFSLYAGVNVFIKFTNTNSFSATAESPITLDVNNTGAKQIRGAATTIPTGTNTTFYGRADYINQYVYDGTYWVWAGSSADNNTTYSNMSTTELTTGTSTTARTVRSDYLKAGINSLIDTKIGGLDVASVGGTGKYISAISETDGKISATASNMPTIPSKLSDLTDDSTHRTVTDTEKSTWNSKADKKTTMDSYYGTSSTGADTAAKVITVIDDSDNFSLRAGIAITVKFAVQNTANNPTFNVNNTGAKSIYYNNAAVTTGNLWTGGNTRPSRYVYDGTYWVWIGHSMDNNTTYTAMSTAELTTGTATTLRTVRADYLKSGINSLIDTKINGLDVASVGGTTKYISTISETNGKISATAVDFPDLSLKADKSDLDEVEASLERFQNLYGDELHPLVNADGNHIIDSEGDHVYSRTAAILKAGNNVTLSADNTISFAPTQLTVTLLSNGWSNKTQTVTATGVTASNLVMYFPAPASYSAYVDAEIYATAQGTNSLTFTCDTVPSTNITVNVVVFN